MKWGLYGQDDSKIKVVSYLEEQLNFIDEQLKKPIKEFEVTKVLEICMKICITYNIDDDLKWIKNELQGYPDLEQVPEYRTHLIKFFDRDKNEEINVPNIPIKVYQKILTMKNPAPIITLEEFLKSDLEFASFQVQTPLLNQIKKYDRNLPKNLGIGMKKVDCQAFITTLRVKILEFTEKIKKNFAGTELFLNNCFTIIKDTDFRQILNADYKEIIKCYQNDCIKSGIILAGSIIEAVLLDHLLGDEPRTDELIKERYKKPIPIKKLTFSKLIEISEDLELLTKVSKRVSYILQEFRNIIHPENQKRKEYVPVIEDLKLIVDLLNSILRRLA